MRILEANVDDIGMGGVFSLVRNFILFKASDDSVDIAAYEPFESHDHISELEGLGSHVFFVGHRGNKLLKQFFLFRNMRRLVRTNAYDCIHIHADVANKLLVLALAAKSAGCKRIVLHSHASDVDGAHRWLKKFFHFACRPLLPFVATDFMSCSQLASQWMFPSVPTDKVFLLKNGVDLSRFAFSQDVRQRVRSELNLHGRLVVGHVGRFAYQKNHKFLLDFFSRLLSSRPDALLLLVGEGELLPDVQRQADSLGKLQMSCSMASAIMSRN